MSPAECRWWYAGEEPVTGGIFLIKNIFKYWGGKQKICNWVIDHFPNNYENMIYIEPFCGSAVVLLNKNKSKKEYLNDTDESLFYVYRAIRERPDKFGDLLESTLYSVNELNHACDILEGKVKAPWIRKAWAKVVALNMSFLGSGKRNALACSKGRNYAEHFRNQVGHIGYIHERLRDVEVFNKDAEKIIQQFDGPDVFFYLDPPYPGTNQEVYSDKYTIDDFNRLVRLLRTISGKFLISFEIKDGMELYNFPLVKRRIARNSKNGINNVIRGDTKTVYCEEVLMMNYQTYDQLGMGDL